MIREAEDVNKHSYNENYIFSRVCLLTRFSEGRVAPFIHGTLKHLCTTSPQRLTARCVQFISVHFSHSTVSDTLWTAAHQTSLSITNSQSLLKLMSMESVMPGYILLIPGYILLISRRPIGKILDFKYFT